ncbi:porphobilinogen synthase [bacterium]|nr:porphobilinogen synthase [bacterium]
MTAQFPIRRLRRMRMTPILRDMVRETALDVADLIAPVFVCPGERVRREIPSMPGVFNLSIDQAVEECRVLVGLGIRAVLLFGIPEQKDDQGSGAWLEHGIVQRAIRAIRDALGDTIVLIADTCLCEYTSHGHCGVVGEGGKILNDPSIELIARTALSQARAGADIVAPSDMFDGRVGAIRRALDGAGFTDTPIMSYAVKFASAFYGPFRDAAQGAPKFGDRKSHQMDPANAREALEEARLDAAEGADILIVKPALTQLDTIAAVRRELPHPIAAYHVSGEYAMLKAAARNGWIDEAAAVHETTLAIKRAGADLIITYFAAALAKQLMK